MKARILGAALGSVLLVAMLSWSACGAQGGASITRLRIDEPGFDGKLTVELYHEPGWFPVPPAAGDLVLVRVSQGEGKQAFFVVSDLALELGTERVHHVAQEDASDLLGQALGGRLRPGEVQLGFFLTSPQAGLTNLLAAAPESVTARYAHHRASWRRATDEEMETWHASFDRALLGSALNVWWEWTEDMSGAPAMTAAERDTFAEMMLPGQGALLVDEKMSHEAVRNAILRFGDRRLQEGAVHRRVAPNYPPPARQMGIGGLVIVLAYVSQEGKVEDATLLASNTAHLLNLAALSAATEWEFAVLRDAAGVAADGWRLLPFQFKLAAEGTDVPPVEPALTDSVIPPVAAMVPPRVLRRVDPDYPEVARQKRLTGTVIYKVEVDAAGKLLRTELVQGVHPILDAEALLAVERTRFEPALRNGVPVAGVTILSFDFGKKGKR